MVEYGIASGQPDDRCIYRLCPKKGKVKKGDKMVEVGIMGYRFHYGCWLRMRRRRRP